MENSASLEEMWEKEKKKEKEEKGRWWKVFANKNQSQLIIREMSSKLRSCYSEIKGKKNTESFSGVYFTSIEKHKKIEDKNEKIEKRRKNTLILGKIYSMSYKHSLRSDVKKDEFSDWKRNWHLRELFWKWLRKIM